MKLGGTGVSSAEASSPSGAPDLTGLAVALVGTIRLEEVLEQALLSLGNAAPGATWALLVRLGNDRFRAALRGHVGHGDLRRVVGRTSGPRTWLSIDRAVPDGAIAGQPTWWTAPFDPERSDRAADVILALWPGQDPDERVPWSAMARTVRLIASAADSALTVERLLEQSSRDPLTGALNRRGILDLLDREQARSRRTAGPLSVLFLDIDRFKAINDRFGHTVGDDVLTAVSDRLRGSVRAADAVGRVGGDEFLIVLPDTEPMAAGRIGRRLADRIRAAAIHTRIGPLAVEITFGAAGTADGADAQRLVERADQRMLARKRLRAGDCPVPVYPTTTPDTARAVGR